MLNVLLMCFIFRVYESLISIDTTPWHLVWYWAYLSLLLATYSMKMVTSALPGWSPNNVFQGHWDPQVKCATLLAQFVLFFPNNFISAFVIHSRHFVFRTKCTHSSTNAYNQRENAFLWPLLSPLLGSSQGVLAKLLHYIEHLGKTTL